VEVLLFAKLSSTGSNYFNLNFALSHDQMILAHFVSDSS